MKNIIVSLTLIFGCALSLSAQEMPPDIDLGRLNPYPFINSILLDLHEKSQESIIGTLEKAASQRMLVKEEKVYVEFVMGGVEETDLSIGPEVLRGLPHVELNNVYLNRASAWIRIDQLLNVGQMLPVEYRITEVIMAYEDNEGPGLMNSDTYSAQGGNGRVIAVIDGGYQNLTAARNAGAAPTVANTTEIDYTGTGIQTDTRHGTGCLETVFDHAPNSTYRIYKVGSLADMGTAVTNCINNGVHIITHSLSRYNTGWGDNTGAACAAAANASNNGLLFFTSAGNRNGTHWQGNFNDPNNNNWHNWSGGDEQNNFSVSNTGQVFASLQWNSASTTDHYDLYLYNATNNTILASSTNTNDFETVVWDNNTGATVNVYLAVRSKTANPPQFELFNHDTFCTDFEYASTTNSTTSPSNSTAANVISVGAVPRLDYNSAPGTSGIIAGYSSRGPTNGGATRPHICAPTNTTTVSYNGPFGGTSCATPNAAGAAAAFWSGHSALNASGVRQIMFSKAGRYKDWGTAGNDNIYGRGGVFLYPYNSFNRYILKSAGNTTSLPTLPYYSMTNVDEDPGVPNNRNIIYLDSSDDAPGTILIDRPMFYYSIPGTIID